MTINHLPGVGPAEFRSARALAGLGSAPDPAADPADAIYAPVQLDLPAARAQAGQITETASRLVELGFDGDKLLEPALTVLAEANAHRVTRDEYRKDVRESLWSCRQSFAAGKATLAELDEWCSRWDRISSADSTLSRSLGAAIAIRLQESERVYQATMADKVFPALAAEATKAAEDSAEAAKGLPAWVRTREDARKAGRAAAGVWADLGILVDRFGDLQKLRTDLTVAGTLPKWEGAFIGTVLVSNVRHVLHLWLSHAEPARLPTSYYDTDVLAIELRLSTAVAAGSRPSLYSASEALGNFMTWRTATEALQGKRIPDGQGGTYDAAIHAVQSLPGVLDRYDAMMGKRVAQIPAAMASTTYTGSGVGF